jgi:hypothetical protein
MGQASLIIVAGFIFAFAYMNYSLTHTSTAIVNNYSSVLERTNAQNATSSALHYYIKKLADDQTLARSEPYTLALDFNGDQSSTDVTITKLTAAKPDTFKLTGKTHWGQSHADPDGVYHRDTVVSWVYVTPINFDLPPLTAAIRTFDSVATFSFAGSPTKVHGQDTDTTGILKVGGQTLPAFTVTNTDDSIRLVNSISKSGIITGLGNPPIRVGTPAQQFDVYQYVDLVTSMANQTLSETMITGSTADLGTVTNPKITVLAPPGTSPEVKISGNVTGAGVLIVKADLWVSGTINFKGLVLVVGSRTIQFESTGTPQIFGALMIAGKLLDFVSKGNGDIYYSTQGLQIIKDRLNSGRMNTIAWWE